LQEDFAFVLILGLHHFQLMLIHSLIALMLELLNQNRFPPQIVRHPTIHERAPGIKAEYYYRGVPTLG
jgi:hypothetical protein